MILTQQIFALFALPATVVLVIQTVMLLFGIGSGHDGHFEHSGGEGADMQDLPGQAPGQPDGDANGIQDLPDAGLRLFTVRGLVAFFAIGGWTGIALIDLGAQQVVAAVAALVAGALALLLVAWLVRVVLSLQSAGNLDIRHAIGQIGRVYLTIPALGRGSGKVSLLLQERSVELDALTEQDTAIPTGSPVIVVAIQGSLVVVSPVDPGRRNSGPA